VVKTKLEVIKVLEEIRELNRCKLTERELDALERAGAIIASHARITGSEKLIENLVNNFFAGNSSE
jgi:hypothetical protein